MANSKKPSQNSESLVTPESGAQANRDTVQPEKKEEQTPETVSIRSVDLAAPRTIGSHGLLGKVSRNMEWLTLSEGFGVGVFQFIPGIWLRGTMGAKFEIFVPYTEIATITYEKN